MFAQKFRSSDGFIIFVVGVAVFTDMMLYGLIVPMLPYALSDRVGIGQEDVQRWNSILLGSFGGALMGGSCLIALGLSTLAIALTRDMTVLLVARILQGLSSAVVATVGYAILFDVVGSDSIGQTLGYISMSQSFGLLVGPALGGILYEHGGYFATFIPAFVLIAIEIALRFLVVVKKREQSQEQKEEEPSEVTVLAKGYTANPLYGTTLPPQTDLSPTDLKDNQKCPVKPSADCQSNPEPSPSPPPAPSPSPTETVSLLLASPRILTALLTLFLLNSILTAYDATIPIHIRSNFSLPATDSSLLFLILVSPFLLSPLAGWVVDRYGPYFPATLGFAILTPPVFILQMIHSPSTTAISPFPALALNLFTIGFGSAICLPALMAEVSLVIESIERAQPGVFGKQGVVAFGFGVMNFAFASGFLMGPLLGGALVEGWGWRWMNIVLGTGGAWCFVGVGVVTGGGRWRWLGRKREKRMGSADGER
ncbi:MAG: hypothetical protein Q9166_002414 [cf. Caloplaca sp. 2 TL-2023]